MQADEKVLNFLTIDFEEWFHILDLPGRTDGVEIYGASRIEENVDRLLGLFSRQGVLATFFALGVVAEKHPQVLKRVASMGHELASHGYSHELIDRIGPDKFRKDIRRGKAIIEDLVGRKVEGYRGPGFSIMAHNAWAFDIICEEGFTYDATLYPGIHAHGGIPGLPSEPFTLVTLGGHRIEEFPATVLALGRHRVAFSGGGYFRLCPFVMLTRLIAASNRKGVPVMMYLHPRDIDSKTPRLPMSLKRRFKCYVNVSRSFTKLRLVLERHAFGSIRDWPNGQKEKMRVISLSDFVPQERTELLAG
jgi:polysaccharide deacetylase family protein (PEP-CTERM system associated)